MSYNICHVSFRSQCDDSEFWITVTRLGEVYFFHREASNSENHHVVDLFVGGDFYWVFSPLF